MQITRDFYMGVFPVTQEQWHAIMGFNPSWFSRGNIGIGNGVVPTLVYHNVPVHRATATASVLGFPIAIAGSLGYISRGLGATHLGDGLLGYIYLPALAAIVCTTVIFAPLGVRTALKMQPLPLRRAFGGLLVLVAARMLWTAFDS